MAESDIRKDLKLAITDAMMDENKGVPCGSIVEAGCEARLYHDPAAAAEAFINDAVDRVLKTLEGYGDDLLNDLAVDVDPDFGCGTTIQEIKPLGVQGHLRLFRQRTVDAYDAGTLEVALDPDLIARWRVELEKPA